MTYVAERDPHAKLALGSYTLAKVKKPSEGPKGMSEGVVPAGSSGSDRIGSDRIESSVTPGRVTTNDRVESLLRHNQLCANQDPIEWYLMILVDGPLGKT